MTDLEAIEYRVKRNRVVTRGEIGAATILLGIGVLGLARALVEVSPIGALIAGGIGIFIELGGILNVLKAFAQSTDGWNRALWGAFLDFPDPPLNDWEDRLEDRDAFGAESWDAAQYGPEKVDAHMGDD